MYISGLGEGWSATILKSKEQIDFIFTAMQYIAAYDWNYWIDGITNDSTVTFSSYSTSVSSSDDSGYIILYSALNRCLYTLQNLYKVASSFN